MDMNRLILLLLIDFKKCNKFGYNMKKCFQFIFLISVFTGYNILSQNLHQRFEGIPFTINGNTPVNPFNGGIDIPRYQLVDLDGDNDLDLFVYDRDTSLNYYKNDGSPASPLFKLNSLRYQNISIKNWFFFVDIDADSDKDLFCGGDSQHVRYYRNIGSLANPNFSLQTYVLRTNTNEVIISEAASVPTFADINADGDFDFFTGSSSGKVTYFENIGTAANFNFRFVTDFYAGIDIQGGALDDPRHGASSITFVDIDGDSDKELFWGDLFGHSIYFIKNTGTAQNFNWNVIDTNYPPPVTWQSGGFNMPGVYDIDNDGRNDFFVGVLIGSKTLNNFVYYKNNGPLNNPSFTKMTENFVLSADVGGYSYPCFADIDNDGDKDLFIGCDRSVAFFRNTGSVNSPAFIMVTDSLPMSIFNFNYTVAVGDLDGDAKKDLVIGYFANAKLRFHKNTGTLASPVFTYQPSQLDTMNLVQSSAPSLADLDNDGDLDLLVGNSGGRLTYYRNNGSVSSFNFQLVTNNYQNIFVNNDAAPSLGDLDGDGDLDLLVGNRFGFIHHFRNTGSQSSPTFTFVTNNYAGINVFQNAVPCIVDINTDSDIDLFVGNTKGGLYFYENWDVFGIQQIGNELPQAFSLYQNYPNPFNPSTKIRFDISKSEKVTLKIYDAIGREIATLLDGLLQTGTYEADWEAASYPSGIYFCKLVSGEFSQVRKMVLVK